MGLPWTVEPGEQYGAAVDALLAHAGAFSREDWLKLAYAALDQGVTRGDMADARKAFKAIEAILPEEEGSRG